MDIQKTYLFYDIETTGLNKCFDQVLQFAAIRTDLELNEIEQLELKVRLNPDVIPSPGAIITHKITLEDMLAGESEFSAIKKIHQWMNTPGTISVGYNTLNFDDEFLRFSFYRNLLPPYTHQYQNQCSRMDLYPIVAFYYLFQSDVLQWPEKAGKISLKLENLSRVNHLATGQAHNAMVDVKACVALAKKLMSAEKTWLQVLSYFDRAAEPRRLALLPAEALMIHGSFGSDLHYQAPVLSLGQHRHYKNQSLWLRLDQKDLSTATADNLIKTTRVIKKRNAEPPFLLKLDHATFSAERRAIFKDNQTWVQANPEIIQKIATYYQNYLYPEVSNLDPDAALYATGFPTPHEEFLLKRFHLADEKNRMAVTEDFSHPIYQQLALRILGRHHYDLLPENHQQTFQSFLQSIRQPISTTADYRGQTRLTPATALEQIEILIKTSDTEQEQLLRPFQQYLENLILP